MHASQVHDYQSAATYLAGGRSKVDRPLCNNTRLIQIDDKTIGVKLHDTVVITYHLDGSQTIDTGGWQTMTTKARINSFSAANVGSHRTKYGSLWAIFHDSDILSPPRVSKCRTCKGKNGLYLERFPHDAHHRRSIGPPEHRWINCYRCDGEGRVDYGSKPIPFLWSGNPTLVDSTGKVLNGWASQREACALSAAYIAAKAKGYMS